MSDKSKEKGAIEKGTKIRGQAGMPPFLKQVATRSSAKEVAIFTFVPNALPLRLIAENVERTAIGGWHQPKVPHNVKIHKIRNRAFANDSCGNLPARWRFAQLVCCIGLPIAATSHLEKLSYHANCCGSFPETGEHGTI